MKYINILFCLLLLPVLIGCDKDDNLPEVNIKVGLDKVVNVNDELYVEKGTPFEIEYIEAEGIGSKAMITGVAYYLDGIRVAYSPVVPFGMRFDTENLRSGRYVMTLNCEVAQEGKSIGFVGVSIPFRIVDELNDIENLPEDVQPGKMEITFTDTPHESGN